MGRAEMGKVDLREEGCLILNMSHQAAFAGDELRPVSPSVAREKWAASY